MNWLNNKKPDLCVKSTVKKIAMRSEKMRSRDSLASQSTYFSITQERGLHKDKSASPRWPMQKQTTSYHSEFTISQLAKINVLK